MWARWVNVEAQGAPPTVPGLEGHEPASRAGGVPKRPPGFCCWRRAVSCSAYRLPCGATKPADGKAEYANCVSISTTAAIREMIKPGLLAVLTPVVVGFGFKFAMNGDGHEAAKALGGLLAGVTVSGVLLALFQANSGGAWDNAKKMFEEGEGVEVDGVYHTKGSDAHKAGVVGDTVGAPLKDTSGPSLNILLKLMTVIALVIAPLLI